MDATALAGLVGALIGGGATLLGSLLTTRQQTSREREKWLRERKETAYNNTIRHMLRASNRRSAIDLKGGRLFPFISKEQIPEFFDDLVDSQYWLGRANDILR